MSALEFLAGGIEGVTKRWKALAPRDAWIEDGYLLYWLSSEEPAGSAEGMLEAFIRIHDQRAILRFAKRFGVLNLCRHGLPEGHRQSPDMFQSVYEHLRAMSKVHLASGDQVFDFIRTSDLFCLADVRYWCDKCDWDWEGDLFCPRCEKESEAEQAKEPISAWLSLSAQARAVTDIAAALHLGRKARESDWRLLAVSEAAPSDRSIDEQRQHLAFFINGWLRIGEVNLSVEWSEAEPIASVSAPTFGMLAVELLAAVAGIRAPGICDGCGKVYFPSRKPYANRPHTYCEECRERGTPARIRQRLWRDRQREKRTQDQRKASNPGSPQEVTS